MDETFKKSILAKFLIALILSGSVVVCTLNLGIVQASVEVSGPISTSTTWSKAKSPYVLTGPTFVEMGVTLTIEAGATVDLNDHIIQVNGILRARGSSTNPICIERGKILFTVSSGSWNEQKKTGSIIEYAVFSQSKIEIQDSSPKISHNAFKRGSISVIGNNPHISGGSPMISNNTILGTTSYGSGITISGNNNATISCNLINGWDNGITASNLFYAASSFPIIDSNLITNNTCGIKIDLLMRDWVGNNFPIITGNTITYNSAGICLLCSWQDDGNPDDFLVPTIIQNNNIYNNAGSNVNGACTLDLNDNWWGTTNSAQISQTVSARYMYIPFLTAQNTMAPPQDYNPNPALISVSTPTSTPSSTPSLLPTQNIIVQPNSGKATPRADFTLIAIVAMSIAIATVALVVVMLRRLYRKDKTAPAFPPPPPENPNIEPPPDSKTETSTANSSL